MKYVIRLGPKTGRKVAQEAEGANKRKKNWVYPKAVGDRTTPTFVTKDCGRYSSKCSFTRYEYEPIVGSYAELIDNNTLRYFYSNEEPKVIEAPFGYSWAVDDNYSVFLISNDGKKDFHPNSDNFRWYSKRHIRSLALENYRIRVRVKKARAKEMKLINKAQKEGAMICLKDSLIAGNCLVGTEDFGARHGLDPDKHYKPKQLLKIANGDASRVKLAVVAGLRRHRKEMSAGECLLSSHLNDYNWVYEELPEEVKEKALEKNHDWNNLEDWYENVFEVYQEKLKKIGFTDAKIWFTGFSSQEDGACFDAVLDLDCLTNYMFYRAESYDEAKMWRAINIAVYRDLICGGKIYSVGNYSHENSRSIECPEIYLENCPTSDKFEELLEELDELRRELSQEIYSSLCEEYDYLTSDKQIADSLISNEVEFNLEGEIV